MYGFSLLVICNSDMQVNVGLFKFCHEMKEQKKTESFMEINHVILSQF